MSGQRENFQEQLSRLSQRYPGRETISLREACALLGKDPKTLRRDKSFPRIQQGKYKGITVPLVGLARWLS